jgi:hypothetical protein
VVSRERIAKTTEDLETTAWKGVTWALSQLVSELASFVPDPSIEAE